MKLNNKAKAVSKSPVHSLTIIFFYVSCGIKQHILVGLVDMNGRFTDVTSQDFWVLKFKPFSGTSRCHLETLACKVCWFSLRESSLLTGLADDVRFDESEQQSDTEDSSCSLSFRSRSLLSLFIDEQQAGWQAA